MYGFGATRLVLSKAAMTMPTTVQKITAPTKPPKRVVMEEATARTMPDEPVSKMLLFGVAFVAIAGGAGFYQGWRGK
jgi:hypothetical protein